ncbi:MAG: hypothetical protein FJY73_12985 [Candidatus Eisenbacteria bacterium]|nr:hypothetical protein [Candidatus Eisenbacteria bacterium]
MGARITAILVVLILAGAASAEPRIPFQEIRDEVVPHGGESLRLDACSVAYYNTCSGWVWVWSWGYAEEAGVVFDLPSECGKTPGTPCTNAGFWWYWRYTLPGYNYTVTYRMYAVNSLFYKIGDPLGSLSHQDPVERWNYYPGLGATESDLVALTAMPDWGGYPFLITDNNAKNQQVGCAPVPSEQHTVYYGNWYDPYDPPEPLLDGLGFVNILMDATFSCEETSIEPASWGAIKTLFR